MTHVGIITIIIAVVYGGPTCVGAPVAYTHAVVVIITEWSLLLLYNHNYYCYYLACTVVAYPPTRRHDFIGSRLIGLRSPPQGHLKGLKFKHGINIKIPVDICYRKYRHRYDIDDDVQRAVIT